MTNIHPVYDDALPVPEEWKQGRDGERHTFRFVIGLYELIDLDGIEGMNLYLDDALGLILTDIHYAVGLPGPGDDLGTEMLLLEATGTIEGDS